LAFTRNPSTGTPATYQGSDKADDLFLVDQAKDVRVNGSGGDDIIAISASALAANALYNIESYGNDGDDTMFLSAALVSNSIVQGGKGKDTIGAGAEGFQSSFSGSIVRGGADNDTVIVQNANGGTFNGNKGEDTISVLGNAANAKIYGGSEADNITLDGVLYTNSTFNGSKGNDILTVNSGEFSGSTIYGGSENDIINVNQGVGGVATVEEITVSGDKGNDKMFVGAQGAQLTKATATGGEGDDTIELAVSTSASVDAGVGADNVDASNSAALANITSVFNSGDSVAATATTFAGNTLDQGLITFGKGVDVLEGMQAATDKVDVDFTDSAITDVTTALLDTQLETGQIYGITGTFAAGAFTADANGADGLMIVGGGNNTLEDVFKASANMFVTDGFFFVEENFV